MSTKRNIYGSPLRPITYELAFYKNLPDTPEWEEENDLLWETMDQVYEFSNQEDCKELATKVLSNPDCIYNFATCMLNIFDNYDNWETEQCIVLWDCYAEDIVVSDDKEDKVVVNATGVLN